jgi:hypothetical protein
VLVVKIRFRTDDPDQWRELPRGRREVAAEETSFPAYLRFEGADAREVHHRRITTVGELAPETGDGGSYVWQPFEHMGKAAYGYITLTVDVKGGGDYFVQVVPGRLQDRLWQILFRQVCAAADALVTQWQDPDKPHVAGQPGAGRTRFDPASAHAEIVREWLQFERSLRRIAARPHREFGPADPSRPRLGPDGGEATPWSTADVHENRLAVMAAGRVRSMLGVIAERATQSRRAAEEAVALMRGVTEEARAAATREVAAAAEVERDANSRLEHLSRLRRSLPQVRAIAGCAPHLTPRMRTHPDYRAVSRLLRLLGHESYADLGRELSTLAARRASDIYEYWALFALCAGLVRLGFRPDFSHVARLVREDRFELEIRRNRPITFVSVERGEELALWYERPALLFARVPGEEKAMKLNAWRQLAAAPEHLAPGLYARAGFKLPDFWFELRKGEGIAVGVGDAIFDRGAERIAGDGDRDHWRASEGTKKKAAKVAEYARDLVLVEAGGRLRRPVPEGLVVYCGEDASVAALADARNEGDIVFLPLAPQDDPGATDDVIALSRVALEQLEDFVNVLRKAAG